VDRRGGGLRSRGLRRSEQRAESGELRRIAQRRREERAESRQAMAQGTRDMLYRLGYWHR